MADLPPHVMAYGNVTKILNKIKDAKTPDRFTQDYLSTVLGFTGGSSMQFIPLAKRIGLLGQDGAPTDLYRAFRNPSQSGAAIAKALRIGYPTVFARNEYADRLDRGKLEGLLVEVTGLEKGSSSLRALLGTFNALKAFASDVADAVLEETTGTEETTVERERESATTGSALRLNYTLYLNLPNTADIAVFNAIFKSLRENLLR